MTLPPRPERARLADTDPEVAQAVRNELHRQNDGLELIASENFVSQAVLEAAGSVLTNKYAEGYPGKRYYGGCEFVDVVETLAIDRAKALFGAEHANVQPHSGAQANMAVYFTLLKPGDTVLGMNLAHGGHLTHGHPLNFSGKLYTIVPYGVRKEDERIDYDELARLADEHKPKMIMVGASAYPRVIDFARIGEVARRVGAPMVTDMAHIAGLVAADQHPSPVPHSDFVTTTTHKTLRGPRAGLVLCREQYAKDLDRTVFPGSAGRAADAHHRGQGRVPQGSRRRRHSSTIRSRSSPTPTRLASVLVAGGFRLVSGGTDNHLMLVDVFSRGLTGKAAEAALGKAGITVNKNAIPFDPNPPMVASGIRLGTPAVTTRGMGEREMDAIGELIMRALKTPDDDAALGMVKAEVENAVPDVPPAIPICEADRTRRRRFADSGRSRGRCRRSRVRPAQREMADAVASTLEDGGVLLVEAGTGTGKTLAYLVPAILSGHRVLLSTGTKNLQEQIYFKDLAILRDALACRLPPPT